MKVASSQLLYAVPAWVEANQSALSWDIDAVARLLAAHAGREIQETPGARPQVISALDVASERLGLSSFERKIVVMCAAVELESSFCSLCALAHGDAARPYPTFGLALAAFADSHWSALAPTGPLRRFGLIEVQRGGSLTCACLRIDEAFLHGLAGVNELDLRLASFVTPLPAPQHLVGSHEQVVEEILSVAPPERTPLCVQLVGNGRRGKPEIAAEALARMNRVTYVLDAAALQGQWEEVDLKARAWEREARLRSAGLYIDAHELSDTGGRESLSRFLERTTTPVIVGARHAVRCGNRVGHVFDVHKPSRLEQRELWMDALGVGSDNPSTDPQALSQAVARVTAQFDFDAAQIQGIVQQARWQRGGPPGDRIWGAARSTSRNDLSEIAQRLVDRPTWSDLVLPPEQLVLLHDIVAHARNRSVVHDEWGMGERQERGLGLGVLFHGPSGTGKTLAAEVIGTELDLDVYRVDLSQLVSKFVGETEKNLRRVFDAAETGGAILLFDECDAIFGKRGEVEHGQDRYANLEVSYLLQRMESYRGIAILTTNLRSAIDSAFLRRLRFVVSFPFPDYERRVAIWRHALTAGIPSQAIDFQRLARLNVAGGSIRNIALHAAFLAADSRLPMTMAHLRRAALAECNKLERVPSDVEIGGWT